MEKTTAPPAAVWQAYRDEFPIFTHTTYFNTCSLGALSARVESAMRTFAEEWRATGAAAWYHRWLAEIERLRGAFATLIGADADEVAVFPSITAALSAIAGSFDYRARPKVIISDLEFPTTVYQWLVKAPDPVDLDVIHSPDHLTVPVGAYADRVDGRTQVLVASHVYFTSGAIQDVAALAGIAHRRGAYCLIDAYQSIGQLPLDVHAAGVDFLVTGGLKWLLGGPGIAYLYVRREVAARLRPRYVGWFAHKQQFAFDVTRFEYADGARRFEGGTPAVAAVYAGRAGVDIVSEIGVPRLRARQVELVQRVVEEARRRGLPPRISGAPEHHAGIVTIPRRDPQAVVAALRERGMIIDHRPGVIRLSPYFYNTHEDCERVVDAIADLERRGIG